MYSFHHNLPKICYQKVLSIKILKPYLWSIFRNNSSNNCNWRVCILYENPHIERHTYNYYREREIYFKNSVSTRYCNTNEEAEYIRSCIENQLNECNKINEITEK
jgi:hypothetical protein